MSAFAGDAAGASGGYQDGGGHSRFHANANAGATPRMRNSAPAIVGGPIGAKSRKEAKEAARNRIQVAVRCRPLNHMELDQSSPNIWNCTGDTIAEQDEYGDMCGQDDWTYDSVFGPGSNNTEVYEDVARPIVDSAMDGFNGCVLWWAWCV
jgi:hypothetical protein